MQSNKIIINNSVCGILTKPDNSSSDKMPGVLFLHGFGSDKNEVDNVYEYIANSSKNKKVISLRIDFRGFGESSGKSEQSTIDSMVEDARTALNYMQQVDQIDSRNISVVGFSLGAAIALLSQKYYLYKKMFLISPALNLYNDFSSFLGLETLEKIKQAKEPIDIDLTWRIIRLKSDFYFSLLKHNPLAEFEKYKGALHCFAGTNDFSCKNAKFIFEKCISSDKKISIIDNANHIFHLPDGRNILRDIADSVVTSLEEMNIPRLHLGQIK